MPLLIGTCRLADLIGTPQAGFLEVSPKAPDALTAAAPVGSTAPRFKPIVITNSGGGALDWQAHIQGSSPWLSLMDTSGSAPDTLYVRMDPTGLAVNEYRDTVVVSATGAAGVAQQTPIVFQIDPCTQIPINVNDSLVDTLTSADCGAPHRPNHFARIYSFNGTKDDSISVYVSAGFDAYVFLDSSLSSAAPPFAQQDDCLGTAGDPCLTYQRLPATRQYFVEVTSSAPSDSGEFTLQLLQPRAPNLPTSLDQQSDSVTSVPPGGTLVQTTIILSAVVSDRDLGDSLHLEAEVRPNSTAFNGTPTGSGGGDVANGERATVTANVIDNTSYHWRVRAVDNTGRAGGWVAFGGSPDFIVNVPQPPNSPSGLGQSKPDGTPINVGGTADTDVVVLSATVTDPDPGDQLRLQVEVKPIGTAFADVPDDSSPAVSTGIAQVSVQKGNNTSYHWQARTSDQTGHTSAWAHFGGNPEPNGVDFSIALPGIPNAVTALAQYQNDGTTSIPLGGVTATQSVVLKGIVSDPDIGQMVQMEVEVKATTIAFTDVANYSSIPVANGALATVAVGPLSNNTDYHWQARAKDATNRTGAWVSFPQPTPNLETNPDFRVQQPPVKLVFTAQPPASTVAGVTMTPAIQVAAQDINSQTSTGFTGNVVMTLEPNAGGAVLAGTTTVAAVAGVATFNDLHINKAGSGYVLRATTSVPSLTMTSNAFNITAAATSQLVFTTNPPASTQAGASMTPAIVVAAQDAFFNTTGFAGPVTLSITPGTGTAGATLNNGGPVNAVNGVATFPGVSIDKVGNGYTLRASSGTLKPDTSTALTITPGLATHVLFTVQPSNTAANANITPAVQVTAFDANDNQATSFTNNVTVGIGTNPPGNGILTGTLTAGASNGVASFSNLSIDKIGTGYTLTAASAGLTGATSNAFNIVNSTISPTLSTVVAIPNTITASNGASQSTITVTAKDGSGNVVAGASATISVTGTGNTVTPSGAVTTNGSGQATWTLSSTVASLTPAELKIISAVISSISIVQKDTVTVNSGPATTLTFTSQPGNPTTAGVAINSGSGGVVVTARDQFGNTATSFASTLTMVLGANPAGGVLSGTLTAPASAGVATFGNLRIIKAGNNYQLQASGGALTSPLSSQFNIVAGPPNQLTFTTQPTQTAVQARIDSAIGGVVVTVQDSVGNTTPSFSGQVRIILGTTAGGTLNGGGFITPAAGVAIFPNLTLNVLGTYSLVTTSTGPSLSSDESVLFNIIPGPAKTLDFASQQPTQTVAGQIITPAVKVTARDIQGNTATSFAGNVTVAIGTNGGTPTPGNLGGTLIQSASSGVATFANLTIDHAGPGYTLTASTPALPSGPVTGGTSNSFNIIAGGVSQTLSSISAAPASITACKTSCSPGTTASSITVTAKDAGGNPIVGATVVLSSNGNGDAITQPASTTNASGVATGTISDTLIEALTVSATINTVLINPTAAVAVTAAPPAQLAFFRQPTNTAAGAAITPSTGIRVQILDQFGNLTNATNSVSLSIAVPPSPSGATLSGPNPKAAVSGTARFDSLRIDKAGVGYALAASAAGLVPDESSPFNITAGVVSASQSTVVAAQTSITACDNTPPCTTGGGTESDITVTARDQFGNVIAGAAVVVSSSGTSNVFTPSSGTTNSSGVFLSTFRSTKAQAKTISATISAVPVSTPASVTVNAAGVSAGQSTVVAAPGTITASNGSSASTITVTVEDEFANPIQGATVVLSAAPTTGNTLTQPASTTNASGQATGTLSSTKAESKTVSATAQVGAGPVVPITQTDGVTVDAAVADALFFTTEPPLSTTISTDMSPAVVVTARDQFGNTATGFSGTVTLDFTTGTNGEGAGISGNSVSASGGVATFANLQIDNPDDGSGYTLDASAAGVPTGATSIVFSITTP